MTGFTIIFYSYGKMVGIRGLVIIISMTSITEIGSIGIIACMAGKTIVGYSLHVHRINK